MKFRGGLDLKRACVTSNFVQNMSFVNFNIILTTDSKVNNHSGFTIDQKVFSDRVFLSVRGFQKVSIDMLRDVDNIRVEINSSLYI